MRYLENRYRIIFFITFINYDIPDLFYEKYMNGEMEHKDTFNKRVLTEVPKYVLMKILQVL